MYRYLFITGILCFLLSCGGKEKKTFEYAGGSIRVALDNEPSTFLPRSASDYYSAIVLNQITEGLVGIDPSTLKK